MSAEERNGENTEFESICDPSLNLKEKYDFVTFLHPSLRGKQETLQGNSHIVSAKSPHRGAGVGGKEKEQSERL